MNAADTLDRIRGILDDRDRLGLTAEATVEAIATLVELRARDESRDTLRAVPPGPGVS